MSADINKGFKVTKVVELVYNEYIKLPEFKQPSNQRSLHEYIVKIDPLKYKAKTPWTQKLKNTNLDFPKVTLTGDANLAGVPPETGALNTIPIILTFIKEINGDLSLEKCKHITSLEGMPVVKGHLDLTDTGINTLVGCNDVHGTIMLNNVHLHNFGGSPTNPEFKGHTVPMIQSVENWFGFKPTEENFTIKNANSYKETYQSYMHLNSHQRFITYLEIYATYPDLLQRDDLKQLYYDTQPTSLAEFRNAADIPEYDGVGRNIIIKLMKLLKA